MPKVQRKHHRRRNCFPKSDTTAHSRSSIISLSLESPSLGDLNAICALSVSRCAAEPGGDAGSAGSSGTARSCPVQPPQQQKIASRSIALRWNRLRHAILNLVRLSILRGPRQVVGVGSWVRNLVGTRMPSLTTKIYTTSSHGFSCPNEIGIATARRLCIYAIMNENQLRLSYLVMMVSPPPPPEQSFKGVTFSQAWHAQPEPHFTRTTG